MPRIGINNPSGTTRTQGNALQESSSLNPREFEKTQEELEKFQSAFWELATQKGNMKYSKEEQQSEANPTQILVACENKIKGLEEFKKKIDTEMAKWTAFPESINDEKLKGTANTIYRGFNAIYIPLLEDIYKEQEKMANLYKDRTFYFLKPENKKLLQQAIDLCGKQLGQTREDLLKKYNDSLKRTPPPEIEKVYEAQVNELKKKGPILEVIWSAQAVRLHLLHLCFTESKMMGSLIKEERGFLINRLLIGKINNWHEVLVSKFLPHADREKQREEREQLFKYIGKYFKLGNDYQKFLRSRLQAINSSGGNANLSKKIKEAQEIVLKMNQAVEIWLKEETPSKKPKDSPLSQLATRATIVENSPSSDNAIPSNANSLGEIETVIIEDTLHWNNETAK